jgi:hypothetical protein
MWLALNLIYVIPFRGALLVTYTKEKGGGMKRIVSFLVALGFLFQLTAQEQPVVKDRQYYLDKSKSQRTTAWLLAATGTAMIVGGAIAFNENFSLSSGAEGEGLLMIVGVPVALSSIPLLISAGNNKAKAEAMAGPVLEPVQLPGITKIMPGVGVKVWF